MGFLEGIIASFGAKIAEFVWNKLEEKFNHYMEVKHKISAIATEAKQLDEELTNATSKEEYKAILRKFAAFQDRVGDIGL